jgi:hypothetical protein
VKNKTGEESKKKNKKKSRKKNTTEARNAVEKRKVHLESKENEDSCWKQRNFPFALRGGEEAEARVVWKSFKGLVACTEKAIFRDFSHLDMLMPASVPAHNLH